MKRWMKWILPGLLIIAAAACDGPGASTPTTGPVPTTWIDAPLDGSVLPLEPYKLVFHAASFTGLKEFEVRVNGVVIASAAPLGSGSGGATYGTLFHSEYLWNPPAPGTYLIAVRANESGEQFGPPEQVQVTVSGEDQVEKGPPPSVKPTDTPLSVEEGEPLPIKPSVTPTPQPCMLKARVNLLCRPGTGYEEVDSFYQGDSAEVIAQSQFLLKVIGVKSGQECTVPKDDTLVELSGDCDNLPEFIPLPTATPTLSPTPTPTPTNTERPAPEEPPAPEPERGCTVRQAGGDITCVVPCPAGAAPGEPCTP